MRAQLIAHPSFDESGLTVTAEVEREGTELLLRYSVSGPVERVLLPPLSNAPERRDELWLHTCFEVFVRPARSSAYFELNIAPSGDWALYHFDAPRSGMRSLDASGPAVSFGSEPGLLTLRASMDLGTLLSPAVPWELSLTAVIKDGSGIRSYWALAHPAGEPDFHDPDCFVLHLPPPTAA